MTNDIKTPWLRIIGWSVLIHVILIALSFLEVFVYSLLINPGQDESFYLAHAEQSAPWVSIIFGIVLFYFIARLLAKKRPEKGVIIGVSLPIAYILLDVIMLQAAAVNWGEHYLIFIISFASKILAGYVGVRTVNKKE